MTEQRVATLIVEVEGRQTNLETLLKRVHADLIKTRGEAERTSKSTDGLGGSQQRAANDALRHAQALAKLSAAEGNTGAAVAQLDTALKSSTASIDAQIRAKTQLANLNTRLKKEMDGTKSSLQGLTQAAGGLGTALGAAGFAIGIQQIGQFAVAAAQQANELEKIQAVLQVTTGSQQRYSEVMALAAANQQLFGGTLASNLAPLSAFVQLSNRSGAELENLNRSAQLLLASNPAAAIGDASFALSEFLSNSGAEAALSLADRFNLDKKALTELAAAGTTAEQRLAGLEALLAQQGITAEALNARLSTTAATYDQLGVAISNATTQLGSYISQALQPAALGLTALLTGNAQVEAALAQQATTIATAGGSYTDYAAAIQEANTAATRYNSEGIGVAVSLLPNLSQAQYTYLQALTATGTSYQDALAQAQTYGQELTILDDGTSQVTERSNALSEAQALLAEATAQAAASTEVQATAAERAAAADAELEASANASALAKLTDAQAAQEASLRHDELEQAILNAAASGENAQASAFAIARAFEGTEIPAILELIKYYRQLAAEKAAATGGGALGNLGNLTARGAASATALERAFIQSRQNFGGAAPEARTPRSSRRSGGAGGKSEVQKELEQQLQNERKFQEQRIEDQRRINEQIQESEEEHYDNLLDIQADFEERSLEQQRKNEISKRRTRQSFYEALLGSDLDAATQQDLSAQYEAANAEAERLAQEGRQAQAAEYRRLKAEQLQAEIEYQEKLREAREKGDEEEIAKLEALAALRRDADQAELNDLAQRGDENVNERDEALNQEGQRYADEQAEIGQAAEEASQRQIDASKRTQEENAREIEQLRIKADLLKSINDQKINGVPAGTPATAATATPTPEAAPTPTAAPAAPGVPDGGAPSIVAALAEVRRAVERVDSTLKSGKSIPNASSGA